MGSSSMTEEIAKWLKKANGDYLSMKKLVRSSETYDNACFHAQQCIEKLLKAYLLGKGIDFPFFHDLTRLSDLIDPKNPRLEALWKDFELLSQYAVGIRYPDDSATKEDARDAMKSCQKCREILLEELGLQQNLFSA